MKVSFLLCAYNEEKTIRETLDSILGQTVKPEEIVVVNDGSTDGTAQILEEYEGRCKVIHLPRNTGSKATAQKRGLKHVTGDILAFTDADTALDPKFLENGLPYFIDPLVGGVSGRVLSRKQNWLTSVREIQYLVFQNLCKRGMSVLDSITVIPGCAGIIRRKLFQPSLDTLTEDMDITLRTIGMGYRVIYAPNVKAYTQDPSDVKSYVRQTTRWYSGYFQNLRKYYPSAPLRVRLQLTLPILESLLTLLAVMMILGTLLFSANLVLSPFLFLEVLVVESFAMYGVLKHSRSDLLVQVPTYFLMRTVDLYVWFKCLLNELIRRKAEHKWLRAERT